MYKTCALDLIDLKNDNTICVLLIYAIKEKFGTCT